MLKRTLKSGTRPGIAQLKSKPSPNIHPYAQALPATVDTCCKEQVSCRHKKPADNQGLGAIPPRPSKGIVKKPDNGEGTLAESTRVNPAAGP
jgi:hypothetical protein